MSNILKYNEFISEGIFDMFKAKIDINKLKQNAEDFIQPFIDEHPEIKYSLNLVTCNIKKDKLAEYRSGGMSILGGDYIEYDKKYKNAIVAKFNKARPIVKEFFNDKKDSIDAYGMYGKYLEQPNGSDVIDELSGANNAYIVFWLRD